MRKDYTMENKAKKVTKRERYAQLLEIVKDNAELVEFINHEVELLDRKKSSGSRKLTPIQLENEELKKHILAFMNENQMYLISELLKEVDELEGFSNQKVASLMNMLVKEGKAKKEEVKRKVYYTKIVD